MIIKCDYCESKFSHLKMVKNSCPNCGGSISDETLRRIQEMEKESLLIEAERNAIQSELNESIKTANTLAKQGNEETLKKISKAKYRLFFYKRLMTVLIVIFCLFYMYKLSRAEGMDIICYVVPGILGLIFLIFGFISRNKYYNHLLVCSECALGKVTDHYHTRDEDGDRVTHPEISFYVDGVKHTVTDFKGSKIYIKGEPVYVAYNPERPEDMVVIKDRGRRLEFKAYIFVAFIMFFLGMFAPALY